MRTKKAILVRIILSEGSFFRFLKRLKESRNMKKKDDCWSDRTYVNLSVFSAPFSSRNLKVFFWNWLIWLTTKLLMKLNKEYLVRITLDYQGKFNSILDDLNKYISTWIVICLGWNLTFLNSRLIYKSVET